MLDRAPTDVILLIADNFDAKRDLSCLSRVSKLLHRHIVPLLYRSLVLTAAENDLFGFGIDGLLAHGREHLSFTRKVEIKAPFRSILQKRCPHVDDHTRDTVFNAELADKKFQASVQSSLLISLLDLIPAGALESFRWDSGSCVPDAVIKYLSEKQPQISAISIINDKSCPHTPAISNDLVQLTRLRHVDFVPRSSQEQTVVGSTIQVNANQLEEIALENTYEFVEQEVGSENPLLHRLLGFPRGSKEVLFRSLRKLSLTCISFENGMEDAITTFNFPQLSSLKIRDCAKVNGVFQTLVSSSTPLRLESLEVSYTGRVLEESSWNITPLVEFLRSFKGLKDLFLLSRAVKDYDEEEFWNAIDNHRDSLKRLVYQQATNLFGRHDPTIDLTTDFGMIQSLGICCRPAKLAPLFSKTSARSQCTFVHIRDANWLDMFEFDRRVPQRADDKFADALPDVLKFAEWAFGPDGLPKLEYLAYGDFSYQGRQPYILWRRGATSPGLASDGGEISDPQIAFHEVRKSHNGWEEHVHNQLDFLEACAEDSLLHGY